jgi:hypothetical protein
MKLTSIESRLLDFLDYEFYPTSKIEIYAALNSRGAKVDPAMIDESLDRLISMGVIEEVPGKVSLFKKAWGDVFALLVTKEELSYLRSVVSLDSSVAKKINNIKPKD